MKVDLLIIPKIILAMLLTTAMLFAGEDGNNKTFTYNFFMKISRTCSNLPILSDDIIFYSPKVMYATVNYDAAKNIQGFREYNKGNGLIIPLASVYDNSKNTPSHLLTIELVKGYESSADKLKLGELRLTPGQKINKTMPNSKNSALFSLVKNTSQIGSDYMLKSIKNNDIESNDVGDGDSSSPVLYCKLETKVNDFIFNCSCTFHSANDNGEKGVVVNVP